LGRLRLVWVKGGARVRWAECVEDNLALEAMDVEGEDGAVVSPALDGDVAAVDATDLAAVSGEWALIR